MMKLMKRRHPRLEGLHHSLQWIEERIAMEVFDKEDQELLVKWIAGMHKRVKGMKCGINQTV